MLSAGHAPRGIRIPAAALKGRCPRPLDDGGVFGAAPQAPTHYPARRRGSQPQDANTKARHQPTRESGPRGRLPAAYLLDSLGTMSRPTRPESKRPAGGFLIAPKSGFPHYRWIVLAVAVTLVVVIVLVNHWLGATAHPLPPVGSLIVFVSAIAAALAGVSVGLAAVVVGIVGAFLLLADFTSTRGAVNAVVSAVFWCAAAVGTGLVGQHLRRQVVRRENALEETLSRSLSAKDKLERVLDFGPHFLQGETLGEVARITCHSAIETFGADSARVYLIRESAMELLALSPPSPVINPGYELSVSDFPDLGSMLALHRPSFVRDIAETHPTGPGEKLRRELRIVSAVRLPIIGPAGSDGLLALGWTHAIERPEDELLAVMQRFADQAAIAWQSALRLEAQRKANELHRTLERVVRLAPTFHITGTPREVAKAICEAALATFQCSGAALYLVEGDRLQLLERLPTLGAMTAGRTFPLTSDMPLVRQMRSMQATFVPDVNEPSWSRHPWPQEIVNQMDVRSALYVPLHFERHGPANLLVLSWDRPHEQPDEAFLVIVQRFADQAALAIAHSSAERLHARLEASLLPTAPVEHPSLDVITRYRPGEQRLSLGGDFVGSTTTDDGLLHFVVGDVSGHGPDAAALGATLRSTWKALTLAGQNLGRIADTMTSLILGERSAPNAFATIVAGKIDLGRSTLSWINAAHLPPLLIGDRVISLDSRPVPPLGVGRPVDRAPHRFRLPESWSLLSYTDGLIDVRAAPGSPRRYGEERLRERLGAWIGRTPDEEALDDLLEEIETGSGSHFADDVALLLIATKDRTDGEKEA
jgi:serine phosphatase RsbU (regulator of sigma subunit)